MVKVARHYNPSKIYEKTRSTAIILIIINITSAPWKKEKTHRAASIHSLFYSITRPYRAVEVPAGGGRQVLHYVLSIYLKFLPRNMTSLRLGDIESRLGTYASVIKAATQNINNERYDKTSRQSFHISERPLIP